MLHAHLLIFVCSSLYHRENKLRTVELHCQQLLSSSFSKNINSLSVIKSDMPSAADVRKGFKLTKKNEKTIKATGNPLYAHLS